jgi:hypothetical protein
VVGAPREVAYERAPAMRTRCCPAGAAAPGPNIVTRPRSKRRMEKKKMCRGWGVGGCANGEKAGSFPRRSPCSVEVRARVRTAGAGGGSARQRSYSACALRCAAACVRVLIVAQPVRVTGVHLYAGRAQQQAPRNHHEGRRRRWRRRPGRWWRCCRRQGWRRCRRPGRRRQGRWWRCCRRQGWRRSRLSQGPGQRGVGWLTAAPAAAATARGMEVRQARPQLRVGWKPTPPCIHLTRVRPPPLG